MIPPIRRLEPSAAGSAAGAREGRFGKGRGAAANGAPPSRADPAAAAGPARGPTRGWSCRCGRARGAMPREAWLLPTHDLVERAAVGRAAVRGPDRVQVAVGPGLEVNDRR